MSFVLGVAVVAVVGWILWIWLLRARRVSAATKEAKARVAEDRARRGALPTEAIVVTSAAAIEPQAEREPCPWCGGALHVDQHEVEEHGGDRVRRVDARCGTCSRITTSWFRVHTVLAN